MWWSRTPLSRALVVGLCPTRVAHQRSAHASSESRSAGRLAPTPAVVAFEIAAVASGRVARVPSATLRPETVTRAW